MKGLAPVGIINHVNFVGLDTKRQVAKLKVNFDAKNSHLIMRDLKKIMFANAQTNEGGLALSLIHI